MVISNGTVAARQLLLSLAVALTSSAQTLTNLVTCTLKTCPNPLAPVTQGIDGNLYGTTHGSDGFPGTAFRVTTAGELTTLGKFGKSNPQGLVQDTNGNLYGVTVEGTHDSLGQIFAVTPEGALRIVFKFDGSDGEHPSAALIQAVDGNLYGTTAVGGANNGGVIFKYSAGKEKVVYSFCAQLSCADGGGPVARLVQGRRRELLWDHRIRWKREPMRVCAHVRNGIQDDTWWHVHDAV